MKKEWFLHKLSCLDIPRYSLLPVLITFSQLMYADFSADKTNVSVGSNVNLTWSSPSSCTAGESWSGSKGSAGTELITISKAGWTLFSLNCSGSYEYVYVWGTQLGTGLFSPATQKQMAENTKEVLTLTKASSSVTFSLVNSGGTKDDALFQIDTDSGSITFKEFPDYETPLDLNKDNIYQFDVTASDGSTSTTRSIKVTVLDDNDSPTSITLSASSFDEHRTQATVGTLSTSDLDSGDIFTYILSGTDADLFELDGNVLKTTTNWAANYETKSSFSITITVTDSGTSSYSTTVTSPLSYSQDFTITVNDLNEPITDLTITGASHSAPTIIYTSVNDDTSEGSVVGTFTPVDVDKNDTYTYTLSGQDAALFTIDGHNLKMATWTDYETKRQSYAITVKVSDGKYSYTKDMAIFVNDVSYSPSFTSDVYDYLIDENLTAVVTLEATDREGFDITYSAAPGHDGAKLHVRADGVVTFLRAPDYETPTDAGGDNIYTLDVIASNGKVSTTKTIWIYVQDVAEIDGIELPNKVSTVETQEE